MKSQRTFLALIMTAEISDENACNSLLYIIHSRGSVVRLAKKLAIPRAKDYEMLPLHPKASSCREI